MRRIIDYVNKNLCLKTFLWGLGLSFFILLSGVISGKGIFIIGGDFLTQQIPFNQMIHDSIHNGNSGWSNTTDLGTGIIGSYSFYLLGSPFFMFTLLFPSEAVPYLMAPMLMVKFALAAMLAYIFIRRYVSDKNYAVFGGLLYAFSGFGIYNVYFNHFHEAMITFPMLLIAIDLFMYEKKRFAVAFTVFCAAFVNYYLFVGQAVFILIYWSFRMIFKSYRMTLKEFLSFALEVISGFLCAGIIVVPSVIAVLNNPRTGNLINGWDAIVYPDSQKYVHIITSFLFPPDMPAYLNFAPDSNARWGSVAAWLPLFSMTGVIAFRKSKKEKWLKKLLPLLFLMTLVPVLNSVFQLFNDMYYARWFYMLTMMMSLATVISFDSCETDLVKPFRQTLVVTVFLALLIGLMPVNNNGTISFGVELSPERFIIWTAIAIVSLVLLYVLIRIRKKDNKRFIKAASFALSVVIIIYGNILIGSSLIRTVYKTDYIKDTVMAYKDTVHSEFKDIDNVRSDFYGCMDNTSMYWQIPSILSFHSIVPGSVSDFYSTIGQARDVRSKPPIELYALRGLLSVKYLFDFDRDSYDFTMDQMPGWELIMHKNGYFTYENKYFIPFGFTYDEYITEDELSIYTEPKDIPSKMLKAIVLSGEQAERHKDILTHGDIKEYSVTPEEYLKDCENRRSSACTQFSFENSCFSALFTAGDKDELVFFSIPYDDGWSAEINGRPVEIEKTNIGFMAVRAPAAQTSRIVFRYSTPGLTAGLILSLSGLIILGGYAVFCKLRKRSLSKGAC